MPIVDTFLNKFTMYKVVYFGLLILFGVSLIFSFFDFIFYSPVSLASSLLILYATCFGLNIVLSKLLKVPMNTESSGITALILFFIMSPLTDFGNYWIYILAGAVATISKYILARNKKHIFNPAAFSLFALALFGLPVSFWWIGNSYLFPFVLIIGLLVVRKVRKVSMFAVYFIFALISIGFFAYINDQVVTSTLIEATISYPLIFLGAFMLTEPLTTPPNKNIQLVYGMIVGLLSGVQLKFGPVSMTPELAIITGNLFSYYFSFRKRLELIFVEKKEIAENIYNFIFSKPKHFSFTPGQYMEWTLADYWPDMRGNRRFFTIASSPTENIVLIGVRINEKGSKFKKELMSLKKGEKITAGNLVGDFTIDDYNKKYIFIAGGIGITPFRSIVKNAIDNNIRLNAVLFYSCSVEGEFMYQDIFDEAEKIGLKTIYVCSHPAKKDWKGVKGRLDINLIEKESKDFKERTYYISGPNKMVDEIKNKLMRNGVLPNKLVTDYFSGY